MPKLTVLDIRNAKGPCRLADGEGLFFEIIRTRIKRWLYRFTALTASRPGEARKAYWSEIDLESKEWHLPAERMKMKRPHIVPLSTQAIAVLNRAGTL